jgi:hypothetical protein
MTTIDLKRTNADITPAGATRRRVHPVAVGLLVGAVALGIFVALTPPGQRSQQVLAVRAPLAAGSQLTPGDLQVLSVGRGSGLAVIPASGEASVVGRPVAVGLVAGQLLTPADVGTPAGATAQVGLALAAGEYPPNLAAGEAVQLLLGQGGGGNGAVISSASRSVAATVVTVAGSQSRADELLVTVAVAPTAAQMVAAAAAVGGVAVVGS